MKKLRATLLTTTALGFLFVMPAHAADSTAEAIKALQAQVDALQKQLTEMQTKEKAKAAAASAAPVQSADAAKKEILPGVNFKLGGYLAAEGVYRDRNQNADMATSYSGITLGHTADSNRGEFRGSARSTRLSVLAEGKVNKDVSLSGYLESDFFGAGGTYTKTTSFSPRLRQAVIGVDHNDWGLHIFAGQTWSLATASKGGMSPRQEDLPMVIDASMLPGVVYTRAPQVRIVKDFADNKAHVGLSFENPEVVTTTLPANTTTSSGSLPDIIAKVGYDGSFGHVELFGMTRFFTSTFAGTTFQNDHDVGYGVGVSAFIPVVPKKVDVHANFMAGRGVGRYGVVAMPDFSTDAAGQIKTVDQLMAMVGVIGHVTPTLDAYLYAGLEKAMRQYNANGYGVGVNNANCYTETGVCAGVTKSVWTIAPGVWNTVYKGDYGNLKVGAQYSLSRRDGFSDVNGQPHAFENIGMVSFRYSPF